MIKTKNWKRVTAISACSALLAASTLGGFISLPARAASSYSNEYTVDLAKTLQEFDGWGLSLSWWATEIGNWDRKGSSGTEKREEIMEALYGESGLNLNIARYNIGGGDDPTHTHMTDDRNTPGWRGATQNADGSYTPNRTYYYQDVNGNDIAWQNTPDYRQLWVLDWLQDRHGANGDNDLITEFYSNSPPYWMTISGCSSGGASGRDNLTNDDAHNQAFVEYFLDVYEYLIDQGFTFDNLQPFNESGSYYWGTNGDQEGAYFSAQQKVEVLSLLIKEMEKRGYAGTKYEIAYNWGDETNTDVAWSEYSNAIKYNARNGMSGADVVGGASRFTYHLYGNDAQNKQERLYRAAKSMGQQLYMSEITWTNGDDYDPNDTATGFHYVKSIVDSINAGADAFVFWQGMEDMIGQIKSHTNYGLIQGVYCTQEEGEAQGTDLAAMGLAYQDYILAKSYYLSGQYTKYIRQGYNIINVNDSDTIAAVSPDGNTLVIIKRNESNDAKSFKYDIKGFNAKSVEKIYTDKTNNWAKTYISANGDSIIDNVSASSVTTYVIHGESTTGSGYYLDDSAAKHGTTLAQMKAAIAENGEKEQLYTDFTKNTSGGGSAFFGGDTAYTDGENYIGLRFYGTGFGLTAPQKDDAGQYSIWIDKDPEGDPDATVQLYKASSVIGEVVYRNNTLEEGWHTVYLKTGADSAGHKWVNFDGFFIYTSPDKAESDNSLSLTGAAGVGGNVKFTFEQKGYSDYKIYAEHRTGATAWIRHDEEISGNSGEITVGNLNSVQLRLVAVKEGVKEEYSNVQVVNLLPTTSGVLYFADCGTIDPTTLATGAVLGQHQSVSDQPFGADPFTGLAWGYTGNLKSGKTELGYYMDYEAMTSMMSAELVDKIEYQFTIPTAGNYKVALGFCGGSTDWGTRQIKATVKVGDGSGTEQTHELKGGEYTALYFTATTTGANQVITVTVTNDSGNAQLSAIVITNENASVPLYTSGNSNYNTVGNAKDVSVGADLMADAEATTFTVYYSDIATHTETVNKDNAKIVVEAGTLEAGTEARATFIPNTAIAEVEPFILYMWKGAGELYYNIDMGFTGDGTPPDDTAGLIGTKQSTTHDRQYGQDGSTSWGYVGSKYNDGVNWKDDKENKWSIREGKDSTDGKASLTYKMTGFAKNELLRLGVAGHCSTWATRSYDVIANGETIGTVTLTSGANPVELTFSGAHADDNGELTVIFKQKTGDGPQVGYLKVWSDVGEVAPTITSDKATVERGGIVNLRNIVTDATVYVTDENGILFDSFKADGASKAYDISKLPATSYELHFSQAVEGGASLSNELIVDVPGVDAVLENADEVIQSGEGAAIVKFIPHAVHGVTSLKVIAPDKNEHTVTIDVVGDFYYRATKNGEYKVVIVSNGVEGSSTFTVDNIDEVEISEERQGEFNELGWTEGSVTITLTINAKYGIKSVTGEGVQAGEESKYTITASENKTYVVTVETLAGYTYLYEVVVANIDTTTPALELEFDHTVSSGVLLKPSVSSGSGGSLYVKYNDGDEEEIVDPDGFFLDQEGTYTIYFQSGTGKKTEEVTYHVTYGTENSKLADSITIADDGTVTVTGANSTKLYRAGETAEVEKAEKAGKYYLEIETEEATEIVVFTVAVKSEGTGGEGGNTGDTTPGGTTTPTTPTTPAKKDDSGIMIAGIIIGAVALVAAAVVCIVLFKKGRKQA